MKCSLVRRIVAGRSCWKWRLDRVSRIVSDVIRGNELTGLVCRGARGRRPARTGSLRGALSIALLESFYASGKPIALVCHSPGVLRHLTYNGAPLVKGKRVTGFTNEEEEEVQLTHVVPFLLKTS